MGEHTPTPWIAGQPGNFRIYGPGNLGRESGPIMEAKPIDSPARQAGNRDLTVQSVNAFAALADHLGCDPAELEGVDLVALVEATTKLREVFALGTIEAAAKYGPDYDPDEQLEYACRLVDTALAQLPEKKNETV